MTPVEINLLLYLETCSVDYGGRVNRLRVNAEDLAIIDRWVTAGYVQYGRVKAADVNRDGANWVRLSEQAWADAVKYRRERAERMWTNRRYETTQPVKA